MNTELAEGYRRGERSGASSGPGMLRISRSKDRVLWRLLLRCALNALRPSARRPPETFVDGRCRTIRLKRGARGWTNTALAAQQERAGTRHAGTGLRHDMIFGKDNYGAAASVRANLILGPS